MYIIKLTKDYEKKWMDFLNSSDKATLFHSLEWRDIIIDSYGFEPYYYLLIDENDDVQAIFPSFHIKSFLSNKLCSVPYNYYGGPIYKNEEAAKLILNHVIQECKKLNVDYLEIKMFHPLEKNISGALNLKMVEDEYLSLVELSEGLEDVKKKFRRDVKRKLKKISEIPETEIRDVKNKDEIKEYYNVMVNLYKKKFLTITQSYKFIEFLWERFVKHQKGYFKLFVFKKKIIGGTILLDSYDSLLDVWSISEMGYSSMSPTSALILEGIKLGCLKNKKTFDLGMTSKDNESLLDSKTRFGATNIQFTYYYAMIKAKKIKRIDYDKSFLNIRKFIKYVPNSLMKTISKILIKHFA